MSDEVDVSNDNIERDISITLKTAAMYHGPSAVGKCLAHDCGERLAPGQRWCNVECRNRWERKMKGFNHE